MIEKIKILTLIYGLLMQGIVYLFSELFEFDNILIVISINAVLYVIPYFITVYLIKENKINELKKLCIYDLIFYLIPTVIMCPIYEGIAVMISGKANASNGIFSVVMIIIYILVYLIYLLIYKLNIAHNIKKHR